MLAEGDHADLTVIELYRDTGLSLTLADGDRITAATGGHAVGADLPMLF